MMKKRMCIFLSLVLLILATGGCGKEGKNDEPLVVAMELAYPPFEGKDEAG